MNLLDTLPKLLQTTPTGGWRVAHYAALDQLHIGGLPATRKLLNWLPKTAIRGLDMGAGLGGCARILALEHGCAMTATDIDADYIKAAQLLDQNLGTPTTCHYQVANSLDLPFSDHHFDFILSQHAMMPIDNKAKLLQGIKQVLKPGGSLLLHEVYLAPAQLADAVAYPTPWANERASSYLQTWHEFEALSQQLGWHVAQHEDETAHSLTWLQQTRAAKTTTHPPALNARLALGKEAGKMSANVLYNLQQGRIEVHSARLVVL
ncbi:MAG: class I SAM-dependent methyltransferase [Gammaproteobacteria bacterium]|nr:class I SAM-dependent methyltransferase [Gammaproteobacteria bacterium]